MSKLRPGTPWFRLAPSGGAGGGLVSANFTYNEVVGGTINGVNATFTLAVAPSPTGSLVLRIGRQEQEQGVDYTLSGSTITYSVAPDASLSGEPHRASYRTA